MVGLGPLHPLGKGYRSSPVNRNATRSDADGDPGTKAGPHDSLSVKPWIGGTAPEVVQPGPSGIESGIDNSRHPPASVGSSEFPQTRLPRNDDLLSEPSATALLDDIWLSPHNRGESTPLWMLPT